MINNYISNVVFLAQGRPLLRAVESVPAEGRPPLNTLRISSQRFKAGMASMRTEASRAITSASALECDVAPCFLQSQVIGTKVLGPVRHKKAPVVDFESVRSPAKLASVNNESQQSSMRSPT